MMGLAPAREIAARLSNLGRVDTQVPAGFPYDNRKTPHNNILENYYYTIPMLMAIIGQFSGSPLRAATTCRIRLLVTGGHKHCSFSGV
jgi:hypothetical protein